MSEKSIKISATSGNTFASKLRSIYISKKAVELEGNFLKQGNKLFTHENMVNGLIVYQLHTCSRDLNTDFIVTATGLEPRTT